MACEMRLRSEDRRFPDRQEAHWAKVARAFDVVEAGWMTHSAGPLDMAQITLACALTYLDFRHSARD